MPQILRLAVLRQGTTRRMTKVKLAVKSCNNLCHNDYVVTLGFRR